MNDVNNTILRLIDGNEELRKDYVRNYKNFHKLVEELNFSKSKKDIIILFKMCFSLGLFKSHENETYDVIKRVLKRYPNILSSFSMISLSTYKPGFYEWFLKLIDDLESDLDFSYLYNNYEMIKKQIIKSHEQLISDVNTLVKKQRAINNDVKELEVKLNALKKNMKCVSKEELLNYLDKRTLIIDEKETVVNNTLLAFTSKEELKTLKRLYEESKGVKKVISFPKDNETKVYYKWLNSDDPLNLILGYEVNCCAKIGGKGYDIMVQSMLNPRVANLVVFDENKVIAKATAYYDQDNKYVLFNNAEVKHTSGVKANAKRRKEVLLTLNRAIKDLLRKMNEQGLIVGEIRMGLQRNSLLPLFKMFGYQIIRDELLENYHYKGYEGDANTELGQVVLYRDNDKIDFENLAI